jgi:hypothetical protein
MMITPLPPRRWTPRRKAALLAMVRLSAITIAEAFERYGLSEEEFLCWQRDFDAHGLPGLRATRRWPPPARLSRQKPRPRRLTAYAAAALTLILGAAMPTSATELPPTPDQGCIGDESNPGFCLPTLQAGQSVRIDVLYYSPPDDDAFEPVEGELVDILANGAVIQTFGNTGANPQIQTMIFTATGPTNLAWVAEGGSDGDESIGIGAAYTTVAHSDDVGRAFRLMSATCSDRSRPAVPIDVGRGGGAPAGRV